MFRTQQNWLMVAVLAVPAMAQQYPQQPYPQWGQYPDNQYPAQYQQYPDYNPPVAYFAPQQLEQMVSRIALYPDPLLAQIFAAATFPDQIQPASQWADQHHYLTSQGLAYAIQNDRLGFDPSVEALLPFPSVLQMMASDMSWTNSLGNAFVSQGPLLQDAVQRMRQQAYNNGYLRTNEQIRVVTNGTWTEIAPIDPGYIVVPYYDPAVVYYRQYRPGARFGISFGYGVAIGGFFNPWGWEGNRFAWDRHEVYVNNRVWDRPYIVDRHVGGYRNEGRYEDRRGVASRPDIGRREMRRTEETRRPEQARPDVGRREMRRPEDIRRTEEMRRPEQARPDVGRGEMRRPEDIRRTEETRRPEQARPDIRRPEMVRPDAGRDPAMSAPAPRQPEQHQIEGRNNNERRAADSGRPAPRETLGREERRRN